MIVALGPSSARSVREFVTGWVMNLVALAVTAAVLIYNMIAVKDFSTGLARINRPVLFTYQPESQSSADYLKSKLGDKLRLERFEGDGHALFIDDPQKFNQVLEAFLQTLPN